MSEIIVKHVILVLGLYSFIQVLFLQVVFVYVVGGSVTNQTTGLDIAC